MSTYRYQVELKLQAPVLSKAVGTRVLGLDAAALRDRDEKIALPGTLVRGHLREAWELFATHAGATFTTDSIDHWLGRDPDLAMDRDKDQALYEPRRSKLRFDEYWVADRGSADRYRHRIEIDSATGAVRGGALAVIESPHAPGQEVIFCGEIVADLRDDDESNEVQRWLKKGFKFLPAVGGLKGVGFGKLLEADVKVVAPPASPRAAESPSRTAFTPQIRNGGLSLGLHITPRSAFCFAQRDARGNRYVSTDHIPGAAVKGVLVDRLGGRDFLRKHFDRLRITHAFPVARGRGRRPLVPPLSLVQVPAVSGSDDKALYDVALRSGAGLIHGRAPAFAVDWKPADRKSALTACGWDDPPRRRLIVRNRFDPETGTVRFDTDADAGDLFTIDAVVPDQHEWLANLYIPDVPEGERDALVAELLDVLAGDLAPLGKTRAAAWVLPEGRPYFFTAGCGPLVRDDGHVVIALQSQALLLSPDSVADVAAGRRSLHEAYVESWHDLSQSALTLSHFYARQTLGGGRYWWNRFRHREKPYRPVVLTEPGSVFVLQAADRARAEALLEDWRNRGLPQLKDAPGGEDYKTNPWIRENGYGEIAINCSVCPDDQLEGGVWHDLTR